MATMNNNHDKIEDLMGAYLDAAINILKDVGKVVALQRDNTAGHYKQDDHAGRENSRLQHEL